MSEFDYTKKKGTRLLRLYQLSYSHPSFKVRRCATYCLIKGCCYVDMTDDETIVALDTIKLPRTYDESRNCWLYICPGAKLCYDNYDFWGSDYVE